MVPHQTLEFADGPEMATPFPNGLDKRLLGWRQQVTAQGGPRERKGQGETDHDSTDHGQ